MADAQHATQDESRATALRHNDPKDFADAVAAMQQMMAAITTAPSAP